MRRIVSLFLFFAIHFSAQGQTTYLFNKLTTAQGLNTNNVTCILQDTKGFLWIGTKNGLQRFDGRKFINFRLGNPGESIPPYGIDQILDAGNNKIWVRQGNIVGLFDLITFKYTNTPIKTKKPYHPQTNFNLSKDTSGNIFLCISLYGLLAYNPHTGKFSEDRLPIRIPEGWPVNSIYEHSATGDYYICSSKGLALYQPKTGTLTYNGHNPLHIPWFNLYNTKEISNFYIDKENTWWISYWDYSPGLDIPQIIHYSPQAGSVLDDKMGAKTTFAGYFELAWTFETRSGDIWFGGLNALLKFEPELHKITQYRKPNPKEFEIKASYIYQMYEDRENNIWVCTDNGLYNLTPERNVKNFLFQNKENNHDVIINAILETGNGETWIGSWGSGILIFDKNLNQIKTNVFADFSGDKLIMHNLIWDLHQHSKTGYIWAVSQAGGLAIIDPNTKKIISASRPSAFDDATIRKVIEDKDGNLLFGTQWGQLVRWNYGTNYSNNSYQKIRKFESSIFSLLKDTKDRIWVGTHTGGVYVMDPTAGKELHHFLEKPFLNFQKRENAAVDIVQHNDSIFFVSSGFLDIININTGKMKTLTQYDGLPGAGVNRMLQDDDGILWFTNNNGLVSYNYRNNIFINYNERNGIVTRDNAVFARVKMKNGELWFGGENSMYGFVPEALKVQSAPPNVTLTDFRLFDRFLPLDSLMAQKAIFKPNQNSFTIYFSSLSYTQQDKLMYYYKLDGVDNTWVKADANPSANYTTLPSGEYTFHVKCVNMNGEESPKITHLPIVILPHFYQTWWFLLLAGLAITGLTYVFYRLRLTKLLAVERIRIKVARDLHDDIGSTLSTINILSSMAKSKLGNDPVKTSQYLTKITDNSQQMMEAMDDIVWSIKPDNDNMLKITARMREYASSILEPKDVEIVFEIQENIKDVKLDMETRRDVFLIFKEAVNNCAKYSRCTVVIVTMSYDHKKLTIQITDNGIGFNVQKADSGNGLGNMRKRAQLLHGQFTIESGSSGTRLTLIVPVNS